jgi:LuxR family transcriptional regulator, maltose regulon positive regulatory protein
MATGGTTGFERLLTPAGDPVMTAKFLVPVMNAPVLERPRLLRLLTEAAAGALTLISAPAGSGKTVLASSWVRAGAAPGPVGWISLDEEDDLPGIFWTYVLTGLQRADADLAGVGMPEDAERVDHSLLVRLASRLSERSAPIVLVLDNAETITRQQICDDLDFLVRHAAGRLRLVLVTRVDPGLPLPQYRLEGSLAEIRFSDLAFPPDEARQLLSARRPELTEAAVQAFSYRTRGWAAGLRLADVTDGEPGAEDQDPAVVAASDIALYFRTEVLEAQPPQVRDFLLATSVVRTLVPGLATHLSGLREAEATLRVLAQTSVFVEVVPGEDDCFRYHPLVRDLLMAQLRHEYPARWRRLNRKAANWLTQQGGTCDAVRQFAATGDWEDAAAVVVRHGAVGRLLAAGPAGDLAVALAALPDGFTGPQAAAVAAAVALVRGDLPGCDKSLLRARELVPADAGEKTDDLELAVTLVALARAAAAGGIGGIEAGVLAEAATLRLGLAPPVDSVTEALLTYGRGCALVAAGELEPAAQTLAAAVLEASAARQPYLTGLARARLALAEAMAGRLGEAAEASRLAAEDAVPDAHGCPQGGDLAAIAALAWVASERGELADALARLRSTGANRHRHDDLVSAAVLVLVRCRLLRARGDLPGALAALDEFGHTGAGVVPAWLQHRLAAAAVGVCLAQGRPDVAIERLPRQVPEGHVAQLLALGWVKLATGAAAESGRLARQVTQQPVGALDLHVTAHLLAAASALALGQAEPAGVALRDAVRLAAAVGSRRPLDEAPSRIRSLLDRRRQALPAPALPAAPPPRTGGVPPQLPAQTRPAQGVLIQPLTEREREVLGYLDALLPTDEIAARMFVSVNTVKTHVRAILRKLSAERRNEAVRRARELGLL